MTNCNHKQNCANCEVTREEQRLTDLEEIQKCYLCQNKNLEYHVDDGINTIYYELINGEVNEEYIDSNNNESYNPNTCIYCPKCDKTIYESVTKFIKVSE